MMTDRQRKVLADAFTLVGAGARRGKRIAESGTAEEAAAHVAEMQAVLAELRRGLESHVGASAVLDRAARAKTLRIGERKGAT